MTYAALVEAVLALSGGLEPGIEPVSLWGNKGETDPVCRLFHSQGGAAAFAAALTRTLFAVSRRLPEVAMTELTPPVSFGCLLGKREIETPLTLPVPGCRGVSFRYRGRGALTFGNVQKRLARDATAPCRVTGRADTLTITPDPGQTLTIYDLAPFGEGAATAAQLPLVRGMEAVYDIAALCPRFALALAVTPPAHVVGDVLTLPRFWQGPVTLTAALFPPQVTADDVLQNGGLDAVPVPEAASACLALGVAADLFAAEPDLPAALWRAQFEKALAELPRQTAAERVADKRGWV